MFGTICVKRLKIKNIQLCFVSSFEIWLHLKLPSSWTLPLAEMLFQRCRRTLSMFGLSKERPILGDHPKAHIHEIRRISCGFHVKSTYKTYKSNISRKTSVLWSAVGRLCPPDFERPIARNGKPYVSFVLPTSNIQYLNISVLEVYFIIFQL